MSVEVLFTAEGKTISHFRADALEFWEGVMVEVSEEELARCIPDFDELPFQITCTDPNFIETMWEICVHYEYVSQDYDKLETSPDVLTINNRVHELVKYTRKNWWSVFCAEQRQESFKLL